MKQIIHRKKLNNVLVNFLIAAAAIGLFASVMIPLLFTIGGLK